MKQPGRIQRWLARAGMLVCIALITGWIVSEYGRAYIQGQCWGTSLHVGDIGISHADVMGSGPPMVTDWGFHSDRDYLGQRHIRFWLPRVARFRSVQGGPVTASGPARFLSSGRVCFLPIWIPLALSAVATGFLSWSSRRRIPEHCCQKCGYNLTGNIGGVCPECSEP